MAASRKLIGYGDIESAMTGSMRLKPTVLGGAVDDLTTDGRAKSRFSSSNRLSGI